MKGLFQKLQGAVEAQFLKCCSRGGVCIHAENEAGNLTFATSAVGFFCSIDHFV